MNALRTIINTAVGDAISANPKYFAAKQEERARAAIVRKIMAALLRDEDEAAPDPAVESEPKFTLAAPDSREAKGYANLRRLAGAVAPRRATQGQIVIMRPAYGEAVFALADLPPSEQWHFLTDHRQVTAWREFFDETLPDVTRRAITVRRNDVEGILMPFYWPPSASGKVYDTPEAA